MVVLITPITFFSPFYNNQVENTHIGIHTATWKTDIYSFGVTVTKGQSNLIVIIEMYVCITKNIHFLLLLCFKSGLLSHRDQLEICSHLALPSSSCFLGVKNAFWRSDFHRRIIKSKFGIVSSRNLLTYYPADYSGLISPVYSFTCSFKICNSIIAVGSLKGETSGAPGSVLVQ